MKRKHESAVKENRGISYWSEFYTSYNLAPLKKNSLCFLLNKV